MKPSHSRDVTSHIVGTMDLYCSRQFNVCEELAV